MSADARTPQRWIRPDIQALTAYHVPDPGGLIKLDAMENPYRWGHPQLPTEYPNAKNNCSAKLATQRFLQTFTKLRNPNRLNRHGGMVTLQRLTGCYP